MEKLFGKLTKNSPSSSQESLKDAETTESASTESATGTGRQFRDASDLAAPSTSQHGLIRSSEGEGSEFTLPATVTVRRPRVTATSSKPSTIAEPVPLSKTKEKAEKTASYMGATKSQMAKGKNNESNFASNPAWHKGLRCPKPGNKGTVLTVPPTVTQRKTKVVKADKQVKYSHAETEPFDVSTIVSFGMCGNSPSNAQLSFWLPYTCCPYCHKRFKNPPEDGEGTRCRTCRRPICRHCCDVNKIENSVRLCPLCYESNNEAQFQKHLNDIFDD